MLGSVYSEAVPVSWQRVTGVSQRVSWQRVTGVPQPVSWQRVTGVSQPVSRIVSLVSRSQCRGSVSLVSRSESLINCGSDRSMVARATAILSVIAPTGFYVCD